MADDSGQEMTTDIWYMGEQFALTFLRPTGGSGFKWHLDEPDGVPICEGPDPVPDIGTAMRQARAFLRSAWPYGRENPSGESHKARRIHMRSTHYILLLRPDGAQFGWSLYTEDGDEIIHGTEAVTNLGAAELVVRAVLAR